MNHASLSTAPHTVQSLYAWGFSGGIQLWRLFWLWAAGVCIKKQLNQKDKTWKGISGCLESELFLFYLKSTKQLMLLNFFPTFFQQTRGTCTIDMVKKVYQEAEVIKMLQWIWLILCLITLYIVPCDDHKAAVSCHWPLSLNVLHLNRRWGNTLQRWPLWVHIPQSRWCLQGIFRWTRSICRLLW